MNAKTLLRFVIVLFIAVSSFYYLSKAAEASSIRIQLEEEKGHGQMIGRTSNTEYIFFESISKFVTTTVVR
jgi:hypothetical protein